MTFLVRPELPTASVGSSHAPTAAVDNSAPSAIRPNSTYKSGKVVQTNGATSLPLLHFVAGIDDQTTRVIFGKRHRHEGMTKRSRTTGDQDGRISKHVYVFSCFS